MKRYFILFIFSLLIPLKASTQNPCVGKNALLNLINRPSNADSPCTIPAGQLEVEGGYRYQGLWQNPGDLQNFPMSELRFGVASQTEFFMSPPSYMNASRLPSGWAQASLGLKHLFMIEKNWLLSAQAYLSFPDQDPVYGSKSTGAVLDGIFNYNLSATYSLTFMLELSHLSAAPDSVGNYYTSLSPSLLLTYAYKNNLNLYLEVYGTTKTYVQQGGGSNLDLGILYAYNQYLAFDFSVGHRLSGALIGFSQYAEFGLSWLL